MAAFYNSPAFGGSGGQHEEIAGIQIVRADRTPCPVCGHPTGDCAGGDGPPKTIFGYNTHSSFDNNLTFYVEEDIVEKRDVAPNITAEIVIHKKGSYIPLSEAKELGLIQ